MFGMTKKYEAKIYKSDDPLMERTRVFEATCFEEAVSRAYVWRVQLSGNTHAWRFKKVALMARQ